MNKEVTLDPSNTDRFRLLVAAVQDYGIFMLDPGGHVMSWNAGAAHIKGYSESEVLGRHFSMFYPAKAQATRWPDEELRRALAHGKFEEEGWRVRKNGEQFWASVVITALYGPDGMEHSSKRMNEFLAMLAHELRNPLAPIRNAVSILQLEPAPSASLRSSRDMIDRQLTHMTRLVDDLLDAGRLTSGKIRIRPEPTSFNQIVARAVEATRPLMDARNHEFELDLLNEDVEVNADSTRLAQVIQNLLGNAAKFTQGSGLIKLRARVDGGRLRVQISDNGAGISPGSIGSIFELFSQGDGAAASRESGLGIGLSLARSLVEMHGGTISASSEGVGKGSVFTFELPGASATPRAPHGSASGAHGGMLVVDDNKDAADSLAAILRLHGYRVTTAYDGASALKAAHQDSPQAVFLDIGMPGMNGGELLRALRTLPGGETMFATAVSGYGVEDEKAGRADFAGFDAQLLKPVELAQLREVLGKAELGG